MDGQEHGIDLTAQQVGHRRAIAPVGYVRQEDMGGVFQQLHGQMVWCAHTGRGVVDTPRLALGGIHQIECGFVARLGVGDQEQLSPAGQGHWAQVFDRIKAQAGV